MNLASKKNIEHVTNNSSIKRSLSLEQRSTERGIPISSSWRSHHDPPPSDIKNRTYSSSYESPLQDGLYGRSPLGVAPRPLAGRIYNATKDDSSIKATHSNLLTSYGSYSNEVSNISNVLNNFTFKKDTTFKK